ncbi:MAG TPA: hydroxymethylbilane synthase, partial [Acidaminococcaceae bacterium]|nr:hydroxymethylbilane synthase [Acidaminococcaceae bacterium]
AFLGLVEGGCQVPIGVHADLDGDQLHIQAVIASLDGSRIIRDTLDSLAADAVEGGRRLGTRMLGHGGREILAEIL